MVFDILSSSVVAITYRIIPTIREHIAAEEALAGGGEAVGVDEAAEIGVVITALQVIEPRLLGMRLAKGEKNARVF